MNQKIKAKTPGEKSNLRLSLILYPFVWGAVAINLFMVGLAWQRIGLPVIPPIDTLLIALVLAIPVNWLCTRWIRHLISQAEK